MGLPWCEKRELRPSPSSRTLTRSPGGSRGSYLRSQMPQKATGTMSPVSRAMLRACCSSSARLEASRACRRSSAACRARSMLLRGAGPLAFSAAALAAARGPEPERAWALKRDWTDAGFQEGAEANAARLREFEDLLALCLQRSCARVVGAQLPLLPDGCSAESDVLARVLEPAVAHCRGAPESMKAAVLGDPEVLGSALDMAGAYLKNYAIDRAACVVETVLPVCRRRGGLWLLKALNHLATVRMKQARHSEALAALEEVDAYVKASLQPQQQEEAWEFWETVYRNFAWVLSSLKREEEAISYVQRAVDIKARVGRPASWFDLWDLGRMKAAPALLRGEAEAIQASQALVTKALWLHREAEPGDLVMRAKLWHSVGECSLALGHLAEGGPREAGGSAQLPEARRHHRKALKCFSEAHRLLAKTEGRHHPLTGGEAQAVAWVLLKLGSAEEAKVHLLDALEALSRQQSGWGERECLDQQAPALLQATQTVDSILEAHRRTDDREGLACYFAAIERLCENLCARLRLSQERADAAAYEKLVSSCSMVLVASGTPEGLDKSRALLRSCLWQRPATPQARLCGELLLSPSGAGLVAGAPAAAA
mmetsp:Transcript_55724/g.172896  ORF Transcript_55724/g.172896 Transcript_55724/m.172896 type:complete len:600 (-) Transcript_55724:9-1808(-)